MNSQPFPNPTNVKILQWILSKKIVKNDEKTAFLVKNISYNIQYLESLDHMISKIDWLHFSIKNQFIKTFIITTIWIIEAVLYHGLNDKNFLKDKKQYSFYSLLKLSIEKEIIAKKRIISKLDSLREMRNKVHLHIWEGLEDSDFNSFKISEYRLCKKATYYFLDEYFDLLEKEEKHFQYLLV